MTQLKKFKLILDEEMDDDVVKDDLFQFYLDNAADIICDIRNSDKVELKFLTTQIKIAVELYNKRGAEGQISHSENGIDRVYERSDVSNALLRQIPPIVRTPFSKVRVIDI